MRAIKFRALDLDNNWAYGHHVEVYGVNYISTETRDVDNAIHTEGLTSVEIKRETLGQFIGLTDVNEREIYEGDVLAFDDENSDGKFRNIATVKFEDGRFTLANFGDEESTVRDEYYNHDELAGIMTESVITGNIHEHDYSDFCEED
jgi:YopX protein.